MIAMQWSHSLPEQASIHGVPGDAGESSWLVVGATRARLQAIGGGLGMKSALEATWAGGRRAQEFGATYGA
jgi:hypothetical protein